MATEKEILSRIAQKHDTEANWNKAKTFIPKKGEIIIYDTDASHNYERMKIGDGSTSVVNLPFYFTNELNTVQQSVNNKTTVNLVRW